jgi:hypothetical protein
MFAVAEKVLDYFQARREEAPRWDPAYCGDDLMLHANNRRVSSKYWGYNGVQSAQPCSIFSVEIINGHDTFIGFAPRHQFRKNEDNFLSGGWFLCVVNGRLSTRSGIQRQYSGVYASAGIPVGSVVTAIHDMRQHTIEFQVNGTSLGIAFHDVPHDGQQLFAAADLYYNSDIRILDEITIR